MHFPFPIPHSQFRIRLHSNHLSKLLLSKNRHWWIFFNTSTSLVVKGLLSILCDGPEQLHYRNIIGAGIGTLAATHTGCAHVGYTSNMIKDGIGGHFDYEAGRSLEEVPPLSEFREDEFNEVVGIS